MSHKINHIFRLFRIKIFNTLRFIHCFEFGMGFEIWLSSWTIFASKSGSNQGLNRLRINENFPFFRIRFCCIFRFRLMKMMSNSKFWTTWNFFSLGNCLSQLLVLHELFWAPRIVSDPRRFPTCIFQVPEYKIRTIFPKCGDRPKNSQKKLLFSIWSFQNFQRNVG